MAKLMVQRRKSDITLSPLISYYEEKRPLPLENLFRVEQPLEVEIGSGLGEFIVNKAGQHPDINFVGIEVQWKRVRKILRKIYVLKRETSRLENHLHNLRILTSNAELAFDRLFAPRVIKRIYCLFPCPWPKKKHVKYRLFSKGFLRLINNRMVEGGEVFIVTDSRPYYEWILEESDGSGFKLVSDLISPQFDTKFERKWQTGGQTQFYRIALTKAAHQEVVQKKDWEVKTFYTEGFDYKNFQLEEIKEDISVVFKDILYDEKAQKAMILSIVSEENISQHFWIMVKKHPQGWKVSKAEGHSVIPTEGIARTLAYVYEKVKHSYSRE